MHKYIPDDDSAVKRLRRKIFYSDTSISLLAKWQEQVLARFDVLITT
ncbi:MAG: hypothetical protein IJ011_04785 [Clostridia bacterium]|nr:hypothetical protein [Clostridia bacterium]